MGMQAVLQAIYPPTCLSCDAFVTSDFGLCSTCWRDTAFITGLVCDKCGLPLPGNDLGQAVHCDDCLTIARPWSQGRAALLYKDNGRKLVLQLKHADRLDLARPAARWLLKAGHPLFKPDMLLAPIPLHWIRFLRRRYNQSALLSAELAKITGLDHCPDLLIRRRATKSQGGKDREGRFANMADAISPHPRRVAQLKDRHVLLLDDVMTSGATLSAATEACLAGGAEQVSVLVLARVAKDA